jgi:hypothetical protein
MSSKHISSDASVWEEKSTAYYRLEQKAPSFFIQSYIFTPVSNHRVFFIDWQFLLSRGVVLKSQVMAKITRSRNTPPDTFLLLP